MMISQFWIYLGVSVLVIVTPGPDTVLTIRNTLLGGRRAGISTALGVALGQATWSLATSIGIVGLLVAWEPTFIAIKLAGAAYLVALGVQALWAAVGSKAANPIWTGSKTGIRLASAAALRQGLLSNLGNAKMAVFFTSLLPQFVPADAPSLMALLALGLLFSGMTLAWLTAYAVGVSVAGTLLRRSAVRRAIEGETGAVLIALGLRLALEQR